MAGTSNTIMGGSGKEGDESLSERDKCIQYALSAEKFVDGMKNDPKATMKDLKVIENSVEQDQHIRLLCGFPLMGDSSAGPYVSTEILLQEAMKIMDERKKVPRRYWMGANCNHIRRPGFGVKLSCGCFGYPAHGDVAAVYGSHPLNKETELKYYKLRKMYYGKGINKKELELMQEVFGPK